MVPSWAVSAFALAYVGLLFAVAYHGDRMARRRGRDTSRPVVYALSLAVYCTSWTFYGSVGLSARSGYDFLPIYIGPILMFALGWPLLRWISEVSKRHNITSIADFIAARYGKSQILAAAVTVIAVIGVLPYLALQLKAVSTSFMVLTRYPEGASPAAAAHPVSGYTELGISLILALFAILFGTRQIDATERHEGLILAIAFESLVKLFAFLVVGAFVTWGMFGGFGDLASRVAHEPALDRLFLGGVDGATWVTMTGLALTAVICLPRQFHVTIVENASERDLRKAAWLFPLYLVAINIFVVPIAIAGLTVFPAGRVDGDMFVLALPIVAGQSTVALLAFIGGFSAATGMVIVSCVALSNMVSNDLVMPIVLHGRRLGIAEREDMGALIRNVRRAAIVAVMLLGYGWYRIVGDALALASIGLLSFAATAQFAPALVGGLIWRGGNAKGALAGIVAGFLVWVYTLLLPSLAHSGWGLGELMAGGPFGIGVLRPQQLFGLRFPPLTHGVFWSLLANGACYVIVSLFSRPRLIERIQASAFADPEATHGHFGVRAGPASIRVADLTAVVARYLGAERAQRSFADLATQRGIGLVPAAPADFQLVRHAERLLASAIGAPSARLVMALALERRNLGLDAAMRLLDDASAAIQYNRGLLQATLENVRQGISVFDADLRLVCWNRHFRDLLDLPPELGRVGITLQDVLRFGARRGEYGPGDADAAAARQLEHFIGEGETVFELRRPDGQVLEIRTDPMPGGGYVTTYSDVTEHVQAAAQLAAANELLEQRVRERTGELTALNTELNRAKVVAEEANLGKTRFLAAVSHDLLQPLNAARLYLSSLLERQSGAGDDPAGGAGALARKIDASLGSVEELLNALLDISRLDAGALVAERQEVPLDELFHALKVEFAPLAERKGLDLAIVPSALTVDSDRRLLHRVLQNLLSNAVRYTRSGKVLMGVRRSGGHVLIQVADSGIGIPHDKQPLVFQEFQRFAVSGAEHGLGLGLSIVERISTLLGHPVSFRSEPGHGTIFTVRVPRGSGARRDPRSPPAPARLLPALDHTVVLCLDNDPNVLDGMRTLLEGWGCRVLPAASLAVALAVTAGEARHPDALVLDYHLDPGADGIACLDALRRRWGTLPPAILVTADRSDALKARAEAAGLPVLNKPLKPAALRALLMRALATRHAAE